MEHTDAYVPFHAGWELAAMNTIALLRAGLLSKNQLERSAKIFEELAANSMFDDDDFFRNDLNEWSKKLEEAAEAAE
jgi:hypothetical protein|tara:strand:+ start:2896 stop:3126 length:231 start_codon:yes stop_codon:yes gene_type:complete